MLIIALVKLLVEG